MVIRNEFSEIEQLHLAQQINNLIQQEPRLTKRTLAAIQKDVASSNFHIAFNNRNNMLGFMGRKQISGSIFELFSWYVKPRWRKKGIGTQLLMSVTTNTKHHYIIATFYQNIVSLLMRNGFRQASLNDLPIKSRIHYVLRRNIRSIMQHFFNQKSIFLMKP